MSDAMTSDEYLAHLRATGQAGEETPAEMGVEEYREWRVRQNGELAFISAPEMAAEAEKKKHGPPAALIRFGDWLSAHCSEPVVREYKGIPGRGFKFDFAVPSVKLCFEYDGINVVGNEKGSGHRSITGMTRDVEKGNLAVLAGWVVIRVNARSLNPKNGATGYAHAEVALRQKGVWRE